MKSIRSFIIPLGLFLAALAGAVALQNRMIDRWHHTPQRFRDTLYLPSSDYVRIISLGYNQFAADFLWLRMIQVFAASYSTAESPAQINTYCEVISGLDPRFIDPYTFAMMGIGDEGRRQSSVAEREKVEKNQYGARYLKVAEIDKMVFGIVDRAIVQNPGDYHVPYAGAFYAYWTLNDPALAKYFVRIAKTDPNYPDFIARWEGYFDVKQGRYRAAYEKYITDYITAIRNRNKDLYSIFRTQLNRAIDGWFVDEIKQRAKEWQKTHGQFPTVEDLRKAGAFRGVELPNVAALNKRLYDMLDGVESAKKSEAEVSALIAQTIRKWDDLPPGPFDFVDPLHYRGYVIWRARDPRDERFILSMLEAYHVVQGFIQQANRDLAAERKKSGKNPPLSELEMVLSKTDPFGTPWVYDRAKGVISDPGLLGIENQQLPHLYMWK